MSIEIVTRGERERTRSREGGFDCDRARIIA